MMNKDDGGPAFPCEGTGQLYPAPGMSLREFYAGLALQGMLAHATRYTPRPDAPENWHDAIAQEAHQIADAMLAARKVKP